MISKNFIIIDNESSVSKENSINCFNCFSQKVESFISIDLPFLTRNYNYFKIDFSKCNYIFITPEPLLTFFLILYPKILNSLIFFPKDSRQATEILNDKEKIGDNENWIVISPCDELIENIQIFNENKNIYHIFGYCLSNNHKHDIEFFSQFSKFYVIADSSEELIDNIFKQNNIYYYRKIHNYEINNNCENNIFELNYNETKILMDFNNDCSKNCTINNKFMENYFFKIKNNESYFAFIKSFTLLNHYLEDENYDILSDILENFLIKIIKPQDKLEKLLVASNLLINLHLLYLYFSNYPFVYGALDDEDINKIFSKFNSNLSEFDLLKKEILPYNLLIKYVDTLSSKVASGISILNEKNDLKIL